jgi:hypothetical protein
MRPVGRLQRRLPLHPRPLPHEALSSWVDRLAAAYGLGRRGFLRVAFGADPAQDDAMLDTGDGPPDLAAALADRTGVSPGRVRAMTLAGYTPGLLDTAGPGTPWRTDDLMAAVPRCCPRCLATEPDTFVRLHWRLAWMASCPRHGEALVPLAPSPWLRHFVREREPLHPAPDLLALDRITLGAVTTGTALLPCGGAVPGGAWLRTLRALLYEVAQPTAMYTGMAGAWLSAGRVFDLRQDYARLPFERLAPERRTLLLRVAAAVVRHLAVRPAPVGTGTALRARVAPWCDGPGDGAAALPLSMVGEGRKAAVDGCSQNVRFTARERA